MLPWSFTFSGKSENSGERRSPIGACTVDGEKVVHHVDSYLEQLLDQATFKNDGDTLTILPLRPLSPLTAGKESREILVWKKVQ